MLESGNTTNQQAISSNSLDSASETKREVKLSDLSEDFIWFLVGFAEGDGSWAVYDRIPTFLIKQKNREILDYIVAKLGFGTVNQMADGYYNLSVRSKPNNKLLAQIFNGRLVFNKTKVRFKPYYEALLEKYSDLGPFDDTINYPSLENAWVSGLTQADGSFNVLIKPRQTPLGAQLKLRWMVDQNNEKSTLEHIKSLFCTGTVVPRKSVGPDMYRYSTEAYTKASMHLVVDYFTRYPVLFEKYNDYYIHWLNIYNLANSAPLTPQTIEKIRAIKDLMGPSEDPAEDKQD